MSIKRIVSFLPSATELLYEFGVQDNLYGVTHECKYPSDANSKPQGKKETILLIDMWFVTLLFLKHHMLINRQNL